MRDFRSATRADARRLEEIPKREIFSISEAKTYRFGVITDETFAKILKGLQVACDRLASEGLTLALENARSLYANTGGNMARLLDAVRAHGRNPLASRRLGPGR